MESLTAPRASKRRKVHQDETPKEVKAPSNGMDQDTFLVYMAKIEQQEAVVALQRKKLAKIWKLFLNEGGVRKDAELVRKFLAQDDPNAALQMMQRIKQYATWLDVPIGQQISLFEIPTSTIPTATEQSDRAYKTGYVLGVTRKEADHQAYPADHEHHQQHMKGWHAGREVAIERMTRIELALESDGKKPADADAPEDEREEA
jgi:hypothetical protein